MNDDKKTEYVRKNELLGNDIKVDTVMEEKEKHKNLRDPRVEEGQNRKRGTPRELP